MRDDDPRAALRRHGPASDASDVAAEREIHDGHAVPESPQSGERLRGRHDIQASREAQPDAKRLAVRRIQGGGDLGVSEPLGRHDLPSDTVLLARALVGRIVVRETVDGVLSGRIVETEAYPVGDAPGHAFRGRTPRNGALFLDVGHAYVYVAYGLHAMLNVSSEAAGVGAGVLIRALEPIGGIAAMQRRRDVHDLRALARGPGRLAGALDIDRRLDGIDLCRPGPLWLARDDHPAPDIGTSVRIGITLDADRPLRFYARGNRFVSGTRALNR